MAITLAEQAELAENDVFVSRVHQAALTVALEVMVEEPSTLAEGEHAARAQLAQRFMNGGMQVAQRAAYTLATASPTTDPSTISDASYLTFIRNNWTAMSGFNPLAVVEV